MVKLFSFTPNSFYQPFSSSVVFYFLLCQKGSFYFPDDVCRGPNEWQVFRPSLVFTRTPRCFARQSGQSLALDLGHFELDQLHWLHKWLTRLKSLLWSPSVLLRDGCHWLKVGGRQGNVSVQSVYQYSFYLSCHLVDLAVLFSVVQRPVLNCIKLYRLCKKLNVA